MFLESMNQLKYGCYILYALATYREHLARIPKRLLE